MKIRLTSFGRSIHSEGDVEIEYTFRLSPFGSTEYPDTTLRFEHKDLNQPIQLPLRTTQNECQRIS